LAERKKEMMSGNCFVMAREKLYAWDKLPTANNTGFSMFCVLTKPSFSASKSVHCLKYLMTVAVSFDTYCHPSLPFSHIQGRVHGNNKQNSKQKYFALKLIISLEEIFCQTHQLGQGIMPKLSQMLSPSLPKLLISCGLVSRSARRI